MTTSDFYIQDNSDIENKKLEAAKGLYLKNNYEGALKLYSDMLNTSTSYKLYYEIGRCYYKLEKFDSAERYFLNSIKIDANKNPSYLFLGNIYSKRNDITKSIEYWSLAHSFKPDDEIICLNLATSYFKKNMKFQSLNFYQKYLKYAKNKNNLYYNEIKQSIDTFTFSGQDFYQKALRAVSAKDYKTAINGLEIAAKNYPTSYDINYLLGKLCFEQKEYMKAMIYLKQAFCLDNHSIDVLEKLSSTLINLGDYTAGYCCFKRMLPLVLNNQKNYLDIITTIKHLEKSFDKLSTNQHLEWAKRYYDENNYHYALFEYENCILLDNSLNADLSYLIEKIKTFINPEERIIKICFEKGGTHYSAKEYKEANKYFSKIINLAKENSSEYKMAKSRIVNV